MLPQQTQHNALIMAQSFQTGPNQARSDLYHFFLFAQMKSVSQINTGFSSSPQLKSQLPSQFTLINLTAENPSQSKHLLSEQSEEGHGKWKRKEKDLSERISCTETDWLLSCLGQKCS